MKNKEQDMELKDIRKRIRGNIAVNILVYIVYLLAAILAMVCMWAKTEFNVQFNEIVVTLAGPLDGAGTDSVNEALVYCIPKIIALMIPVTVFYTCVYIKAGRYKADNIPNKLIIIRRIVGAFSLICLAASFIYVNSSYGVTEYVITKNSETTIYEQHYANPDMVKITPTGKKKNLIYIYLESMETAYSSAEEGGAQNDNLIPYLTQLTKDYVSFTNMDSGGIGGFYSNEGARWTFGALYTTLSGVPYNLPIDYNYAPDTDEYASGLVTIGDVLEKQGYHNEFLCGSDSEYAGRKQFLKSHGNYEVYDYYTAIEKKVIPSDYYAWWGFEDNILYTIAKEELTRLADEDKPFNFTMLTADTHFPDGYLCDLCDNKYDEPAANVVSCADRQLGEFIEWCKEQAFFEDSVIVITGDHPRMDTVLVDGLYWYDRRIYNCIINGIEPDSSRTTKRNFAAFDIFPTVLAALGFDIEGNKLGLGTNLYSSEKTLAEKYGKEELDQQLAMKSDFYLEEFAPELVGKDIDAISKKVTHVKDKKALKKIKKQKKNNKARNNE